MEPRRTAALFALAVALAAPSPSRADRAHTPTPPRRRQTPAPQQGDRMCTARLTVRQTEGAGGCFIDERVTGAPGVLRYPCGGGPATAAFRNGTFAGTVSADGAVTLSLTTRFHYGDGCDWASTQSIAGSLGGGRLTYRYGEAPVAARRGCASACRATGEVEVEVGR